MSEKKPQQVNQLPEIITASDFEINIGKILIKERYMFDDGYPNNPSLREEIYRIVHNLSFERNLGEPIPDSFKEAYLKFNQIDNTAKLNAKNKTLTKQFLSLKHSMMEELKNNSYLPMIISGKVFFLLPDITLTPKEKEFPLFFSLKLKQYDLHEIDDYLIYHFQDSFSGDFNRFKRFLELTLRQHRAIVTGEITETVKEWIAENNLTKKKSLGSVNRERDKKNSTLPFKWLGSPKQAFELCEIIQNAEFKLVDKIAIEDFVLIFSKNPKAVKSVKHKIRWIDVPVRTRKSNLKLLIELLFFLKSMGLLGERDFKTKTHTNNLYSKIGHFFEDYQGKPFKNIRVANPFSGLKPRELKAYKYPEKFSKLNTLLSLS
ncbi:MAG: hypothetical protein POELPBGB_00760 [Bacteroidia bacterium]|nr:hypothetical protein [Bacteroidia bacterium]